MCVIRLGGRFHRFYSVKTQSETVASVYSWLVPKKKKRKKSSTTDHIIQSRMYGNFFEINGDDDDDNNNGKHIRES